MNRRIVFLFTTMVVCFLFAIKSNAQVIQVGSGSYTKTFPGTDVANRNGFPSGTPNLSGAALGKPVPTNDWWSKLAKETQANNLFTYPYTLKTTTNGLVVSYIPSGFIDDMSPVVMSVVGMAATKTTVSDYSDWTVTMDWNDGTHNFKTTAGIAMPFLYFTKKATDVVQVTVNSGTVTISNEMLVIVNAKNNADFAVYAPTGSTWTQNGGVYTSTLNGKNYWSMAFIPLTASNVTTVANEYKKYAYVFPTSTTSSFSYNESTSVMKTDFNVITEVKEGSETNVLLGLLPHQWDNLATNSPVPNKYSYATIRGEMKTLDGNSFSVENKFHGILPTLPYVDNYSAGFTPTALTEKIARIENDALATWTDSYNEGQVMNRLIQTARIADEMGNTGARDKMLATVKERLEDWLKAEGGEVAFLFYYNTTWSALLGYPAGHGQDTNINDHHFHWGYFIHAASFLEQYQPGWAAQYGEMINLLIRDAASTDRNDSLFPYLRNFSPYAGHCWANGFATFSQGNDQESTSESMQFNSSLIHWGEVTGNKAIRDLGIYLYTTEQTAIEEYWFDTKDRNFPPSQKYSLVSRVWGNNFDNGTFWTADIAASYGIELYPIHGGSLYLGQDIPYATKLWNEIEAKTGILRNQVNPNLWHDTMWQYLAFISPTKAIVMYNSFPNRELKFGISDAQTYHWLHAMNALGRVDTSITANSPIAAAFTQNGQTYYVAHNYTNQPITVTFSTGYQLVVPARKMVTGVGSTNDSQAPTNFTASIGAVTDSSIELLLNANDDSGNVIYNVTYGANSTASAYSPSGVQKSLIISDLSPNTNYTFTVTASDFSGNTANNNSIVLNPTTGASRNTECAGSGSQAQQGSFGDGYKYAFETIGTDVKITFELLDDKTGLIAYLWKQTPFGETEMTNVSGNIFTKTITGQAVGSTITYAVKFAFAGGMAVTKYFSYVVGKSCSLGVETASKVKQSYFPNPVENILNLRLTDDQNEISVTDVLGKKHLETNVKSSHDLDMSAFKSGIYFLKVKNSQGIENVKIIKK
jgi:endoglucanase Acf2